MGNRLNSDSKLSKYKKKKYSADITEEEENRRSWSKKNISEYPIELLKKYKVDSETIIGTGTFAQVKTAVHKKTLRKVAIKIIPKNKNDTKDIIREAHILSLLRHPYIIKYLNTFQDKHYIYIITEFCPKGELFDLVRSKEKILDENLSKEYFVKLLSAVEYCHGNLIAHRDIKIENIWIDEKNNVKLGDFGFASPIKVGRRHKTLCGTVWYAAPEILRGKRYNPMKTDIWSLGVVLYTMLFKELPFYSTDDETKYIFKVINGDELNLKFPGETPEDLKISKDAKDLLSQMLNNDPEKRITISEIKQHPWVLKDILPSHLLIRKKKRYIDRLKIESIVTFGFSEEEVFSAVWKNDKTICNAIYHLLEHRHEQNKKKTYSSRIINFGSLREQPRRVKSDSRIYFDKNFLENDYSSSDKDDYRKSNEKTIEGESEEKILQNEDDLKPLETQEEFLNICLAAIEGRGESETESEITESDMSDSVYD